MCAVVGSLLSAVGAFPFARWAEPSRAGLWAGGRGQLWSPVEQHQQDAEQRGWEGWGEARPSPAIHGVLLGMRWEWSEMMQGIKTQNTESVAHKRCGDMFCIVWGFTVFSDSVPGLSMNFNEPHGVSSICSSLFIYFKSKGCFFSTPCWNWVPERWNM